MADNFELKLAFSFLLEIEKVEICCSYLVLNSQFRITRHAVIDTLACS